MTPFPQFYDASRIGTLFYPDVGAIAAEAAAAGLRPAALDETRVLLVLIDMQIDFCHLRGSLNVPGALDDVRRVTEFIFRHAHALTSIHCTLDTHLPFQIFHPQWWADADGNPPPPFTLITAADVEAGKWRPVVAPEHSRRYVHALEAEAKKVLTIWPYHVMLGGVGNALDPVLWSAVIWHGLARKTQPAWVVKGMLPHTEHYSAIQPEIPPPSTAPGAEAGGRNQAMLDALTAHDYVLIAGEAESHCVLETLEDIVEALAGQPERLRRLYVLQDCMSPVLHPEVDFHALAMRQFDQFKAQGVQFVNSTDALPFLPPAPAPDGGQAGAAEDVPVVGLAGTPEQT